jgi:hypothetical protein
MKPKNAGEISSHLISSRRAPAPAPARPTRAASHLRRPRRAASKRPRARLLRPRSNPDRESKRSRGAGGGEAPPARPTHAFVRLGGFKFGRRRRRMLRINQPYCLLRPLEREREREEDGEGGGGGRWTVGGRVTGGRGTHRGRPWR